MDNAKKLLLVDPARAMYRPTITDKKLSQLDTDIDNILSSSIPDDEKVKRYLMVLKQHRKFITPVTAKPDPDVDILKDVQPDLRIKAKRLLKQIKPHVRMSEAKELVHNNQLVDDSNISEPMSSALVNTGDEKPIGWTEFADTLKRAHTPRQLIRNEKLWSYMNPRSRKTIIKRKWQHL
jgi:hypothetical protein